MNRLVSKKPLGWRTLTDALREWNADLPIGKGSQAATRESGVPFSSWLNQTYKCRWGGAFVKTAALVLAGLFLLSTPLLAVPPLPDFAVESVTLDPPVPVEDMFVTVTTTITNRGDVGDDARFLDIWFNRSETNPPVRGDVGDWWGKVGRLEAGESVSITSPPIYQPASGSFHLCAHIEFESIVSETTKTNNHFCLDYEAASVSSMLRPIYRFYSPVYKGHFFTISEGEKTRIITTLAHDWRYEGIAYYASMGPIAGTVPLHRFWSARYKGHFFTISTKERDRIIATLSHDWRYEGVAYYVYSTGISGTLPVHRFWSPRYKHHFYTISTGEKDRIIATLSHDWNYEGVAFHALPFTAAEEGGHNVDNGDSSISDASYSVFEALPKGSSGSMDYPGGSESAISASSTPEIDTGLYTMRYNKRHAIRREELRIGFGIIVAEKDASLTFSLYNPLENTLEWQYCSESKQQDGYKNSQNQIDVLELKSDIPYRLDVWDSDSIVFGGWLGSFSEPSLDISEVDFYGNAADYLITPMIIATLAENSPVVSLEVYSPAGEYIETHSFPTDRSAAIKLPFGLGGCFLVGVDINDDVSLIRFLQLSF